MIPSVSASIPKTKNIEQRINKNPLLNPSINFTKVLFEYGQQNNDHLNKRKFVSEYVFQQTIDGLVLNNTLSREGYDFYIMFTHYWTPPEKATDFQIIVKEYSRAGRNTGLAISLNDKELVYRVLAPSYKALDELALAAANHLSNYLKNGSHLKGIETESNLKDSKSDKRITSPFDVY